MNNQSINEALDLLNIAATNKINVAYKEGKILLNTFDDEKIDESYYLLLKKNKQLLIEYFQSIKHNSSRSLPAVEKHLYSADELTPLSYSQERLWFIDRLQGSVQYHIPTVLRISGDLDISILERTLRDIVSRHEVLRTVVTEEDGTGYQQVMDAGGWRLDHEQVSGGAFEVNNLVKTFIDAPFDLSKDYMFRACLYEGAEGDHILAAVFHHISSDGWSGGILVHEFAELYNSYRSGRSSSLHPLLLQYRDYALWQRRYISGDYLDEQLKYWDDKLTGAATLELPTDYPRPSVQSISGASVSFTLEKDLSDKLNSLCRQEGVTLYMLLLSAFKVLLHRYSGQQDILVGSPIAGRTQQELEDMIGFFVNTLVIRSDVDGGHSFKDFLQQVKRSTLEAYDHQHVPFEKVVERVVKERDMSRNPLFQVLFSLQNTEDATASSPSLEGLTLAGYDAEITTSQFDISLDASETGEEIFFNISYSTDLFSKDRIERMGVHYTALLKAIVSNRNQCIGDIDILTVNERHLLLEEFNDTSVAYPDKTIVDLFEEQVNKIPDHVAVVFEEEALTYGELDERSNQLGHYLRSKGVRENTLVGICMERSLEMIIGILAILKAGGAYVPIDPEYPQQRISYMLEDAAIEILITDAATANITGGKQLLGKVTLDTDWELIAGNSKEKIITALTSSNLAYVIYTSGSTGKPKGVMIEHSSVVNLLYTQQSYFKITANERIALVANIVFDASVEQMFLSLTTGSVLVLFKKMLLIDEKAMSDLLVNQKITHLHCTPSLLKSIRLISNYELKRVIAGGEVCETGLVDQWNKHFNFYNEYGPTETTVTSIEYYTNVDSGTNRTTVLIGRPVSNTYIYILDGHDNPVPVGVAGELCIGGAGVARGYLNREDLTAEKFVANPFRSGERMYRTGDLARWLSDGNIEFLGRRDEQVKIRGYRIELGEIESVLSMQPVVKNCCVLARQDGEGNKRLVGYVVMEEGASLDKDQLESGIKTVLPDYMVPRLWVELPELPLTQNGKVDRKNLPDPELSGLSRMEYVAPRNAIEEQLAVIWQELLGVERVGIHDDFFELGGHSLLAIRMASMILSVIAHEMPIRMLLENPVLSNLAVQIESQVSISSFENNHLIKLQSNGRQNPIFILPGTLGFCDGYTELATAFGNDQPVIGINMYGYYKNEYPIDDVEKIAALNLEWIKSISPSGPYKIIGHSLGGVIAYEIMRQLQIKEDNKESILILLDSPAELNRPDSDEIDSCLMALSILTENDLNKYTFSEKEISDIKESLKNELMENGMNLDFEYLRKFLVRNEIHFSILKDASAENLFNLIRCNNKLKYKAEQDLNCNKILVLAENSRFAPVENRTNPIWDDCLTNLQVIKATGDHESMVMSPNAAGIIAQLNSMIF